MEQAHPWARCCYQLGIEWQPRGEKSNLGPHTEEKKQEIVFHYFAEQSTHLCSSQAWILLCGALVCLMFRSNWKHLHWSVRYWTDMLTNRSSRVSPFTHTLTHVLFAYTDNVGIMHRFLLVSITPEQHLFIPPLSFSLSLSLSLTFHNTDTPGVLMIIMIIAHCRQASISFLLT